MINDDLVRALYRQRVANQLSQVESPLFKRLQAQALANVQARSWHQRRWHQAKRIARYYRERLGELIAGREFD